MILGLNHINIVTPHLDETRDFFVEVLGLTVGARPDFDFDGYWLYAGDRPVIHLQSRDRFSGQRGPASALDHAAFDVDDLAEARARLTKHGVAFSEVQVPGTARGQLFLRDPNGVRIELGGELR
jgi:catechol 2,3-dioxygenase-like lactoylglutathione lyase family enzyme